MFRKKMIVLWVLALSVLAAGCAQQPASTPTAAENGQVLENTQWQLVSFDTPDSETPVAAGSEITLQFDDAGRASGSAGCNSYGGTYQVEQGQLHFSEIISTLIACMDNAMMEQEARYLTALQTSGEFELFNDRLLIHYEDGSSTLNFIKFD